MSVIHVPSSTRLGIAVLLAITSLSVQPALAQEAMAAPKAGASPMDKPAKADGDMQKVLDKLESFGGKPIDTLTAVEARKQPTPADAVKALLADEGKMPPKPPVTIKDSSYPTAGGTQPVRIYTPATTTSTLPVLVYYHGGGWVIADIKTYESSAIALAVKAQAIVVSVEYRHAPEFKFPAAHEDAFAAYQWVVKNAPSIKGDPAKIAVAGESAGANLAANVSIMARDKNIPMPIYQLLVYPVAGSDMTTPSYLENETARPLNKAMMTWFFKQTLSEKDLKSPMIDLIHAKLKGLPATTLITAEIDPLHSEGKALADKLEAAGVQTTYKNFEGVTHEFFGMDAVVKKAGAAQDFASDKLRNAFGNGG